MPEIEAVADCTQELQRRSAQQPAKHAPAAHQSSEQQRSTEHADGERQRRPARDQKARRGFHEAAADSFTAKFPDA